MALLRKRVIDTIEKPAGNYSAHWINWFVDRVYGRGSQVFDERDFPTWEARAETAWYQLGASDRVGGVVDEDWTTSTFVQLYNACFDAQIPATIENACKLRIAVLRGAARNFNRRWGVGIYGAGEFMAKRETLRQFYEAGATYFYCWNGWKNISDNAHLPFSYQRATAETVRQAYRKNPNRDMRALLRKAKVAVAIPLGFTFFPDALQGGVQWLHLER